MKTNFNYYTIIFIGFKLLLKLGTKGFLVYYKHKPNNLMTKTGRNMFGKKLCDEMKCMLHRTKLMQFASEGSHKMYIVLVHLSEEY
jgi:hypothetical protein